MSEFSKLKNFNKIIISIIVILCASFFVNIDVLGRNLNSGFSITSNGKYFFGNSSETLYGSDTLNIVGEDNTKCICSTKSGSISIKTTSNGCTVNVNDISADSTAALSLNCTNADYSHKKDVTLKLKRNVVYKDMKIGESWNVSNTLKDLGMIFFKNGSSSNSNVATFNVYDYIITAKKAGKATITAVTASGINFKIVVTVLKNDSSDTEDSREEVIVTKGSFCGVAAGQTQAKKDNNGSSTISSTDCNKLYSATNGDYYKSVWDSSQNCCYISVRKNSDVDSGAINETEKDSLSGNTIINSTSYNILFDCNYGNGLKCDSGFTGKDANGNTLNSDNEAYICEKTGIKKDTLVNFPSSSSSMVRDGNLLMGWTKEIYNGQPNCNSDVLNKNSSYKVNSNTNFYACYNENIGGYRYVHKNYSADGRNDFMCGQAVWIDYCTKPEGSEREVCHYVNSDGSTIQIYRDKLSTTFEDASTTCDAKSTEDIGYRYTTKTAEEYVCGEALYITTCNNNKCQYTKISKLDGSEVKVSGTIDFSYLKDSQLPKDYKCDNSEIKEEAKSCLNTSVYARKGTDDYTLCFNEKDKNNASELKSRLRKLYVCDTKNNYHIDETSIKAYNNLECNSNGICTRTYSLTCTKGDSERPTLTVSTGIVQNNEKTGKITVKATAKEGKIKYYYYSDNYKAPTSKNEWLPIDTDTFTIESTPGVVYIWVRDSKGNISRGVTGVVIDTVNTDTTAKITLYDSNGNLQTPSRTTAFNGESIKDGKYVMMSNDLSKDSNVIADGFNPFDMEYKLEVDSPTITVYATLTSSDSKYVEGYEPRTVNLDYGVNTILIKIQNNEGKVRTYTILVTRTDGRTSDNTLSDLSVSVGSINFNANVTDYKVIIPKTTTSVDVKSTIASDKANYVSEYEPGNVRITGDTTVKLIKIKSETGSTRTYVVTFVKEGTDVIEKDSLQLSDLVIPGVYMPFEADVANYSLSVDYETDVIDINTVLKSEDSTSLITLKKKNDNSYKVVSSTGIPLDEGENFVEIKITDNENEVSYYRLTIIRKEFGLGISDDTQLKELKVLGYDINFKPDKKEYTVRIKQEKSLVITAVPNSNRAEVFIRGNDELTGFSTVRVKVVAENGKYEIYSIDIKKDAFNKTIEIASIVAGAVIILISSGIIIIKKKAKAKREYFEE